MTETNEDIKNVEAWAVVIEDLLRLVPTDRRAEVLALATKNNEAERKKWEEAGRPRLMAIDIAGWEESPGIRHWNTIARLESLVVQVFVRHIKNNHSPQEAAEILFAPHHHGRGSGRLWDYLGRLPRARISA